MTSERAPADEVDDRVGAVILSRRAHGVHIVRAIPIERAARLIVSEGNYLLLPGPWSAVRSLLAEVWYADLDQPERLRRLIDRHVRFGKDETAAVAWATGTDEHNAVLIAATREQADLVVPASVIHRVGAPPPRGA